MSSLLAESKKYTDEVRKLGNEIKEEEVEALKEKYNRIIIKELRKILHQ